jgi:hypothetical protein
MRTDARCLTCLVANPRLGRVLRNRRSLLRTTVRRTACPSRPPSFRVTRTATATRRLDGANRRAPTRRRHSGRRACGHTRWVDCRVPGGLSSGTPPYRHGWTDQASRSSQSLVARRRPCPHQAAVAQAAEAICRGRYRRTRQRCVFLADDDSAGGTWKDVAVNSS